MQSFSGADLTDANLTGATLINTNLSSANLSSATFKDIDLTQNVLLTAIKLNKANLTGANSIGGQYERGADHTGEFEWRRSFRRRPERGESGRLPAIWRKSDQSEFARRHTGSGQPGRAPSLPEANLAGASFADADLIRFQPAQRRFDRDREQIRDILTAPK